MARGRTGKGAKMLYDTGAERTYLNLKTAKRILGKKWLVDNQQFAICVTSINANGGKCREYVFPLATLLVDVPQQRLKTTLEIDIQPCISKCGLNLLGLDAISEMQLPITWRYETHLDTGKPGNVPASWLK